MVSIQLRSRIGADGTLSVAVPTGYRDTNVEVVLVVNPIVEPEVEEADALGWPKGYFEETFGCFADEPLARPDQGPLQVREELR